jgi:hypothetical protein
MVYQIQQRYSGTNKNRNGEEPGTPATVANNNRRNGGRTANACAGNIRRSTGEESNAEYVRRGYTAPTSVASSRYNVGVGEPTQAIVVTIQVSSGAVNQHIASAPAITVAPEEMCRPAGRSTAWGSQPMVQSVNPQGKLNRHDRMSARQRTGQQRARTNRSSVERRNIYCMANNKGNAVQYH